MNSVAPSRARYTGRTIVVAADAVPGDLSFATGIVSTLTGGAAGNAGVGGQPWTVREPCARRWPTE